MTQAKQQTENELGGFNGADNQPGSPGWNRAYRTWLALNLNQFQLDHRFICGRPDDH